MPKVSVIIPAYNAEKYIENCVQSVLKQTEKDIEVIVIDDGSRDNTPMLLEKMAVTDQRMNVIKQQNQGQPKARNKGIEQAKSAYLMFLDADDTYEDNIVETMYESALQTGADVVICGYKNIHTYKNKAYTRGIDRKVNTYARGDFFISLHENQLFHAVWNKLYKKELFKDVKFEDIIPGQDAVLNLQIANGGGISTI